MAGKVGGWADVDGLGALTEGSVTTVFAGDGEVLVANVNDTLLAYRNQCAACGGSLAGGGLSAGVLACPSCAASFDLPKAGRGEQRAAGARCRCCATGTTASGSRSADERRRAPAAPGHRAGHDRHRGGARGRALRPVRARDRRGPPPPAAPGPAPDRVRVRGLHRHARGRRRVPAGGHARGVAARPGAGRRALGLVRHPDRAGVLHAQHHLGRRGGHVPQPRGPDRVRAGPVGLGPAGGRQPGADHAGGRRRGA